MILLTTGRSDLFVIDRVRTEHFWDSDALKEDIGLKEATSIYDGKELIWGKTKGAGYSKMLNDVSGLVFAELANRTMTPLVEEAYKKLGVKDSQDVGRFHWETWVAASDQEVSHGSIGAITQLKEFGKIKDSSIRQGKYGSWDFNFTYRKKGGKTTYEFTDDIGNTYVFDNLNAIQDEINKQNTKTAGTSDNERFILRDNNGKIIKRKTKGISEAWYHQKAVNAQAYFDFLRSEAKEVIPALDESSDSTILVGDSEVVSKERKGKPTYKSTAEEGIAKLNLQPSKPDVWAKKIAEAGGKGTAQELEVIGFTDYLNEWMKENKSKSVPKEVAEQYIKDNQIEVVDVTKDDKSPKSLEQKKIQKEINDRRDVLSEELDSLLDLRGDAMEERTELLKESRRLITSTPSRDFIAQQEAEKEREKIQKKVEELDEKINKFNDKRRQIDNEWDNLDEQLADSRRIYRASDQVGDLRATKYKNYVLNGGKNYREVLLTLPSKEFEVMNREDEVIKSFYTLKEAENYINENDKAYGWQRKGFGLDEKGGGQEDYRTMHWDESNILAHVRMNERTLPNGEGVLFIEEIQSDWAQEGKKKGFRAKVDSEIQENHEKLKKESEKLDKIAWDHLRELRKSEGSISMATGIDIDAELKSSTHF